MHPIWHNKQKLVFIKLPLFFLLSFCLFGAWLKHNELRQNFLHLQLLMLQQYFLLIAVFASYYTFIFQPQQILQNIISLFAILISDLVHEHYIKYTFTIIKKAIRAEMLWLLKNQNLVLSNVNCCSNIVLQCKVCK